MPSLLASPRPTWSPLYPKRCLPMLPPISRFHELLTHKKSPMSFSFLPATSPAMSAAASFPSTAPQLINLHSLQPILSLNNRRIFHAKPWLINFVVLCRLLYRHSNWHATYYFQHLRSPHEVHEKQSWHGRSL